MPTLFTRIIAGELPGCFVWRDENCVAFLSIHPLKPGHALVVPIAEIDHWLDLDASLAAHLTTVAQAIGKAQHRVWKPARVGLMIAGLEVPHVHLHVVPIDGVHDLDFANADTKARPADLEAAAEGIRRELRALGYTREVANR
jgi:histidine triad (HIT) family protein